MSTRKLTSMEINLLGKVIAGRGKSYRDESIVSWSYYDDPIDTSEDRTGGHGHSRIVGDATPDVQLANIYALINAGEAKGLSSHDIAYVLAIARVESGFNHDAAAGTTSASGLGQFIDSTGEAYGLNDTNRWNPDAQARALVDLYLFNKGIAQNRGVGEEYIYKYHHDGSNPNVESGGLQLALDKVIPKLADYEEFYLFGQIHPEDLGPDLGAWFYDYVTTPYSGHPDWLQELLAPHAGSQAVGSPLVIDVDGDGIELAALNGTGAVYWDDADGFREASGWIAGGDGLLALDRNGSRTPISPCACL